ncbi:pentapeptide repeat-containing protein [Plantactinospora sonchi]|uniref:Pentapeptide repeat-containing protein n=1 Tax=Plantactinospora sonchi TaxID=1544735 RepID=A0ABU7RKH6_9ACTN
MDVRGPWSQRLVLPVAVLSLVVSGVALTLSARASRTPVAVAGSGALDAELTRRFTAGIELLGAATDMVRAGGVHTLESVLRDAPSRQPTVTAVLAGFIRQRTTPRPVGEQRAPDETDQRGPADAGSAGHDDASRRPAVDVQAALTVLARRDPAWDRPGDRLDLSGAVLTGASWRDAQLSGVLLTGARLDGADLRGARLDGADLTAASLVGTTLDRATLRDAVLVRADLTDARINLSMLDGAILTRAKLSGAGLDGSGLFGAVLVGADLRGARLDATNLAEANLTDADLSDAYLGYVTAPGADLTRARLVGSNLIDIDLTEALLTGTNFNGALLHGARLGDSRVTADQISCAQLSARTLLPVAMAVPTAPARTCAD